MTDDEQTTESGYVTFTRRDRGSDDRCGTTAGAVRHSRRGEKPCDACAAAKAEFDRRWRSAPENTRRNRLHAKAQARALRWLKNAHLDEYHALYLAAKHEVYAEADATTPPTEETA